MELFLKMDQLQTMTCSPNEDGITNRSSREHNRLQVAFFVVLQPKSMPQQNPLTSFGEYDGR